MTASTPPQRQSPAPPKSRAPGALRGVAQTALVVLAFVAVGLGLGTWAGLPLRGSYNPPAMEQSEAPTPERILVDGFNVLHVGLLRGRERGGWWRKAGRERLLEAVAGFEDGEAQVCVVFDGQRPADGEDAAPGGPQVVFAPSADDWLLAEVRKAPQPERVAVVTADRQLADRARHRGAMVIAPRAFLQRCGDRQTAPAGCDEEQPG